MKYNINWEEKIEQWKQSGKTRKIFCEDEKLPYWTFLDKVKKINSTGNNGLVQITRESHHTKNAESIELIVNKNITIKLSNGYSRELLKNILADIGAAI